jgi:hypothetical protein
MSARRNAANFRWAVPTLFMPAPWWVEAETKPWTCARQELPRPLTTTEPCATCRYWEPQASDRVSPTVADWFEALMPHEAS